MSTISFLVLALVLTGQSGSLELVSHLDPEVYFRSRHIEVDADKLIALAAHEPTSAKESIGQLLAIRWLGSHSQELSEKQKASVRTILGQLARRAPGFSRQHAQESLAQLDDKPRPGPASKPSDSLQAGLAWFPGDTTLFGVVDLRKAKRQAAPLIGFQQLPAEASEIVFQLADSVGNVRIDRISFALGPLLPGHAQSGITVRITGQGNPHWLADALCRGLHADKIEEIAPAVFMLALKDQKTALTFVGQTDLILSIGGNSVDDLRSVLDVRQGRKASLLKSSTVKLGEIPADARGVVIGNVPEQLKQVIAASPLAAAPERIVLSVVDDTQEAESKVAVRFHGAMADAEAAMVFAKGAESMKQQALDGLAKVPVRALKPESVKELSDTVKSLVVQANGASVNGTLTLTPKLGRVLLESTGFRQGGPAKVPAQKQGIP